MPNAVKFVSSSITPSGSIRKGAVALGLNGDLGPTSTTAWYNGITPQSGNYIIYETDTGFAPRIFAPQSDTELIRFVNDRFGGGLTTLASALEELATKAQFLAVNKAYPGIVTDKLVYLMDSTFIPSYPTTGSVTYPILDLVGVGTGSLQNGVGFNSSSGAFIFDGSDDQIPLQSSDKFSFVDWSVGITIMVLYKIDAVSDFNGQFRAFLGVTGGNRSFNSYLYGADNPANTLQYHFSANYTSGVSDPITIEPGGYHLYAMTCNSAASDFWHDSIIAGSQGPATPSYSTAGGTQYLGRADNMWKGNIARWMIYNKSLTETEILQNYYQGNIITDGLVFALDAGNLVSYPGSGTSALNLRDTRFPQAGTLTNGTTFNSGNSGNFVFDGTNDYIVFSDNSELDSQTITMESWVNVNSVFQNGFLFEKGSVNTQYSNFFNSDGTFYFRTMGLSAADLTFYAPSYITVNTWNHIVCTYINGVKAIYVNGVQVAGQTGLTGTISTNTSGLYIGAYGPGSGYFLNGEIAVSRVYNIALKPEQIRQNYNEGTSRFGLI